MTRPTPEFDQRIADWLEDDPNLAPRQLTATVLAAFPSIHQRRRGWFRAGGRTLQMPNTIRALVAIAIVAVVGVAAFSLLNPSPGPGGPLPAPAPSPVPSATPIPTQTVAELGTITLTADGCTWVGSPGSIEAATAPVIGRVAVVNETDTFANFGIYRLNDGRTWSEAQAWVLEENDALHGGPSHPPIDFVTDVGSIDAPERGPSSANVTLSGGGTYGVVCSSNEPPPGLVFAVYVVGPLEVTLRP